MPSPEDQLSNVVAEELDVLIAETNELLRKAKKLLSLLSQQTQNPILVNSQPTSNYVDQALDSLAKDKFVMLAAKNPACAKLVATAEIVKQKHPTVVTQFNQITSQSSLINPGRPARLSTKNVQLFFDEDIGSSRDAALKEIKGHTVYEVAGMRVILTEGRTKVEMEGWTRQGGEKEKQELEK